MSRYKLKIVLLSDLCVSDGGIYNSSIDTEICFDDYGLPYIPARRIKGCLRESADELRDWDDGIFPTELFGKEGNSRGAVSIRNAYLEDYKSYLTEANDARGLSIGHPQNILRTFTYIRTQTAIDPYSGAADPQSLRRMRVVKRGLTFEAEVVIEAEGKEEQSLYQQLTKAVSVTRHMGVARTRGLGEIFAVLEPWKEDQDSKESQSVDYVEGSNYLAYEIHLEEPVVCKSVAGQEENTMDYMEGAKLLGNLGTLFGNSCNNEFLKLIKSKTLFCSNAYLCVNGERLTEVPASLYSIKNDESCYRNKLIADHSMAAADQGLQLSQMRHCYVHMREDGKLIKRDVAMEERYHHRRPEDKSIGRAVDQSKSSEDAGVFYQISSIRKGQTFKGFFMGTPEEIKQVYELIKANPHCSFGYGRNSEYGKCTMQITELTCVKEEKVKTTAFYLLLHAPTIIYNNKAMYSVAIEDLEEEIAAALGIDLQDAEIETYINTTAVGGFNVTWGHRKPTIMAFDKGTILKIQTKSPIEVPVGTLWLGERRMEGYGEAFLGILDGNLPYSGVILDDAVKQSSQEIDLVKHPLLSKVSMVLFRDFLAYRAAGEAKKNFAGLNREILSPTISNMLLMIHDAEKQEPENGRFDKVVSFCNERFSKKSKDAKKEAADKILGQVEAKVLTPGESESLEQEFAKIYQLTNFTYQGETKFEYLKEYLIQLKYFLRGESIKDKQIPKE